MNTQDELLMEAVYADLRASGWAGVDEKEAERTAMEAVQRLADSEPNDEMIEAMERLKGTPQEHLFCVDATTLERIIWATISDRIYDAKQAAARTPPDEQRAQKPEIADAVADLEFRIDLCGDRSVQDAWEEYKAAIGHQSLPASGNALRVGWPIPIVVDHTVPPDELHVVHNGRVVARMVNIGITRSGRASGDPK